MTLRDQLGPVRILPYTRVEVKLPGDGPPAAGDAASVAKLTDVEV